MKCLSTFVEWYFYATSPVQTEETLADQDALLLKFDKLKGLFVNISPSSMNFPKFYSLQYILEATSRFSTPDNFDTEVTKYQHYVDVKISYYQTNK